MASECWSTVLGLAMRATRLDACGNPPAALTANSQYVTEGFISVAYSPQYEDGEEHLQKNAQGVLCTNKKTCDQFKRYNVVITLCGVEPELLELLAANTLVVDANGVSVGFRQSEGQACTDFALETWSGTNDAACPPTNEVVTITEGGSGLTSFTLTFSGQTTASISESATAAQVQAALEALDAIDPGDIVVVELQNDPFIFQITFIGDLAGQNVGAITTTPTGGTGTVTPAVVQQGGVVNGDEAVGYFLLPHVKNGTLRDYTVENGPTTYVINGWTDGNTNWGAGPYNVVLSAAGVPTSLDDPIVQGDHKHAQLTGYPPPPGACGIQAMPAAPTPA